MTETGSPGTPEDAKRRRLLQGLAVVLGSGTLAQLGGGQALSVALAWTPRAQATGPGQLFDAQEMASLRAICDHTIPRTDTPGAVDVDTHGFIDNQLKHVHEAANQQRARRVLARLQAVADARHAMAFSELSPELQRPLLEALDRGQAPFEDTDRGDFKLIKGLVLFGYFTSEAGATQVLAFDPVPGGFTGSIPYASVGKAWGPGGIY